MTGAPLRLMLLHAHPDDETIMTGGTIARYLDEGADVRVVTFTLGEEGEVIGQEWAMLVADGGADQLGGFRIGELAAALSELTPTGVDAPRPTFLGGAGRWRDSGMAGTASAENPRALFQATQDDLVAALRDEIDRFAPHVIVTYDAAGTYGHPDHKRVHEVSVDAISESRAATGYPRKVYESVTQRSALEEGLAGIATIPVGWRMPAPGELPSYPDQEVTAAVDVSAVLDRKVRGLAAHATQVIVAPSGTEYALSNLIAQPIGTAEHFIRTDVDSPEFESDLFEGIR
ncbi:N-acetyl-1-D-myo-inositol-2-amino-2-deoxy-alpha-D-glucopyranoside deacetylase [Gordonia malaquae]|uniref:1D-myo-inositol 2-acetamido-2-deoxy-alpha-D-glucopyranoside deacetylase n=1 Tax=Gordonia malaquae NBRC 108250 TaxID=1223542 RepID=M3TE43_GORML|nr:1D-myo-inositol 2-acetamido-2-deoxy-alpha-D-glucopyranoside deacetylase [Gordonia malaquae NBRC 108250]SED80877.1 N-acetyl-1-D-myo-inositol-2-amino-2-deoxy-alpha-D-glucopyranoside deacetylase [Gordonia malaquae]